MAKSNSRTKMGKRSRCLPSKKKSMSNPQEEEEEEEESKYPKRSKTVVQSNAVALSTVSSKSLKTPSPSKAKSNDNTHTKINEHEYEHPSCQAIDLIYHDTKLNRMYYKSCYKIPIQFSAYVPSKRPSKAQKTSTSTTSTVPFPNESNEYIEQFINISIGDVITIQINSQDTASPKKKFRGPHSNQLWYPFDVPWCTCEVLAIYQEQERNKKQNKKNMNKGPCYFIIRYFNRSTESSLKDMKQVITKYDTAVNINSKSTPSYQSVKKNMEEVYETDLLAIISTKSILGKANLISPGGCTLRKEIQYLSSLSTNNASLSSSSELNYTTDHNGIITVKQFCNKCIIINSQRQYSIISSFNGKCHVDNNKTLMKRVIAKYINQHEQSLPFQRASSYSEHDMVDSSIDEFSFYRYCRGMNLLLNYNELGKMNNTLVTNSLETILERGRSSNSSNYFLTPSKKGKDNDENEGGKLYPPTPCSVGSSPEAKGWAHIYPFHVDVATLKAFYSEIYINTPFDSFMEPYDKNQNEENTTWKLSIGDTVAIHVEEDTKRSYRGKSSRSSVLFPYEVTWWPGEIVAIYNNIENHKKAVDLREETKMKYNGVTKKVCENFTIEVRWFYRKQDIPGIAYVKQSVEASSGIEEIFETDCIDEIDISSLLGPIALFSDSHEEKSNITVRSGIPIVNFFCHQLWSVQRKSLMPIGSSDKRVERAMMYSKYMGRDSATRVAHGNFKVVDTVDSTVSVQDSNWKQSFQMAFSKLTLAESSSTGNKNEYNIIGREREREQISQFLRSAIQASNGKEIIDVMNSNMFVLFIGGAPGTGKTASVKSIIYQFNQEQAEGKLPAFQFLVVNGMELRHPFDVYVRLWEAVSNRKEVCPADEALAKLELHFGGNPNLSNKDQKKVQKRNVVVVLVDEIDYLVTKKQTVLYNLFDWPSRGFSAHSSAQLIVIGISNTLNLPERLHVRLQSRIGTERCMYSSYGINDSIRILKGKLGITGPNESIFHPDAIMFAARKVSSESGDIRKVFHLTKAAAENVYNDLVSGKRALPSKSNPHIGIVNTVDIQRASRKMFHSSIQQGVSDATNMEALLLVSLSSLQRQLARDRGGFDIKEVVTKMEAVANSFGDEKYIPSPTCSELLRILDRLGEATIISLQTINDGENYYRTSGGAFSTRISLQLDSYEVLSAFKETCHCRLAERFLSDS